MQLKHTAAGYFYKILIEIASVNNEKSNRINLFEESKNCCFTMEGIYEPQ